MLLRLLFCFIALLFFTKSHAQFATTIQNLTEHSSAKMHGISLHDLDSDGDLDILATFTDGVVSFENSGTGSFLPEKTWFEFDLPSPNNPLPARFADLDGDGLSDLAANKSWRKNLGSGQFTAPVQVFESPLAALCDVNADGLLDAVSYKNDKLFWQRNMGGGTFSFSISIGSAGLFPNWQFWAVADLDADGFSDLILSRDNRFYWYKNKQNATFQGIQLDATAPKQAIVADVDGDGRADLLAGFGSEIRWLTFDSLGQWKLRQAIPTPTFQGGLAIGDSDGDGDQDLVVGDFNDGSNARLRWFRMLPSGLFSTAATGGMGAYPNGYNRNRVALGDLDGNGKIDLVFGSNIIETTVWKALDSSTPGSFQGAFPVNLTIANIHQVLPTDLDLDGDRDLVAANFLLEKTGNGQFAPRRALNLPDKKVQFADLDGDTLPDAVYPVGNSVAWQRNLGNFQFGTRTTLDELIFLNKDVGIADLDNDGDLDLFAANGTDAPTATSVARWYKNDGAGNFSGHELGQGIKFCNDVFPLDFNEDGRIDLVFLHSSPGSDIWFENLGGGNFSAAKNFWAAGTTEPDGNLSQKMLADLDGDGRPDLVCSTRDYGIVSVYWYQNLGDGVFSDRITLREVSQNASAGGLRFTVLDADDDGDLDIAVTVDYYRRIDFLKNLGTGDFASTQVVDDAGFSGFNAMVHYDVDGDGRLDLVFGNADASNGGKNALSWLGGTGLSANFEPSQNADFQAFPNPVSDDQPLHIFWENDFFGTVKVTILGLDGRVLQTFFEEKTARQMNVGRVLTPSDVGSGAAFFVRVSDGKTARTKLVFKL